MKINKKISNTTALLLAGTLAMSFNGCKREHPNRIEGIVKYIDFIKKSEPTQNIDTAIEMNTATGGGFLSSGGKVYDTSARSPYLTPVVIIMEPIGTVQETDDSLPDRIILITPYSPRDVSNGHRTDIDDYPATILNFITSGDTISIPRYIPDSIWLHPNSSTYRVSEIEKR